MEKNKIDPIDYDDNDLEDNVVGTIPASEIAKSKEHYDSNISSKKKLKQCIKLIIGIITIVLVIFFIFDIFHKNANVQAFFHKQQFEQTAYEHVVKLNYINSATNAAYIAFYGNNKWSLSNANNFGNNLKSITDNAAVTHTSKAIDNQFQKNGINPHSKLSFGQIIHIPGILTTMEYKFNDDGSRVELAINVTLKKEFKQYYPDDTTKNFTNYNYVFANFKNISKNKFEADMSTSFNGSIDKSSQKVVLEVLN